MQAAHLEAQLTTASKELTRLQQHAAKLEEEVRQARQAVVADKDGSRAAALADELKDAKAAAAKVRRTLSVVQVHSSQLLVVHVCAPAMSQGCLCCGFPTFHRHTAS